MAQRRSALGRIRTPIISTVLKRVACAELGADWGAMPVVLHATDMPRVKAKVGSG